MYRIIGTDGKQYGPLSAEVLKQWIAERRVERQTPVLVDGAAGWTVLGLLPEFAGTFAPQTPPVMAPHPPVRTNGFATAGLICGILSIVCCCGCPFSVLGIVFSLIGLSQINRDPVHYEGRAQAIAGLILSVASVGLGIILFCWSLLTGHTDIQFNTRQF